VPGPDVAPKARNPVDGRACAGGASGGTKKDSGLKRKAGKKSHRGAVPAADGS